MPIEGVAEGGGAGLHAREMPFDQQDARLGIEAHRFDQVRIALAVGEERTLGERLVPFGVGAAVRDDAAAQPQRCRVTTRRNVQRADRHVELRVAAGRKMADRAGVDAARRLLHRADHLHRADLWRAGDRTAGEQRGEHVERIRTGAQRRRDGGGHLMDGGVSLYREELGHLDAAGRRDARQVVAHQIHDHEVFGALFRVGGERAGAGGIARRIGIAAGGALHRAAAQRVALKAEEQFGREGQKGIRTRGDDRSPAGAGALPNGRVERQRIAEDPRRRTKRQIGLIDVPRRDQIEHLAQRRIVMLA